MTENSPEWVVGDGVPPVSPTAAVPAQLPPPDPQWRKTVDERLAKIENTMVTKTEMQQGFKTLEERLMKAIQQR